MEIWKDIPGFEGHYKVSNLGNVLSFKKGKTKIKTTTLDKKQGYVMVILHMNNKPKTIRVHRLVALAFLEQIEGKDFVNHKNGIRHDNRLENLEWCTKQENSIHAANKGAMFRGCGEDFHKSKLTDELVLEIRSLYQTGNYTQLDLAEKYGVHETSIFSIVHRKTWRHI